MFFSFSHPLYLHIISYLFIISYSFVMGITLFLLTVLTGCQRLALFCFYYITIIIIIIRIPPFPDNLVIDIFRCHLADTGCLYTLHYGFLPCTREIAGTDTESIHYFITIIEILRIIELSAHNLHSMIFSRNSNSFSAYTIIGI